MLPKNPGLVEKVDGRPQLGSCDPDFLIYKAAGVRAPFGALCAFNLARCNNLIINLFLYNNIYEYQTKRWWAGGKENNEIQSKCTSTGGLAKVCHAEAPTGFLRRHGQT